MEDNRLIAKFMGGKYSMELSFDIDHTEIWLPFHGIVRYDTVEIGKGKILEYHKSYSWLIPVVERIEDFRDENNSARFNVIIEQCFVEIIENHTSETIVQLDRDTKIETIYNAVVEFIKWYNHEQSNSPKV